MQMWKERGAILPKSQHAITISYLKVSVGYAKHLTVAPGDVQIFVWMKASADHYSELVSLKKSPTYDPFAKEHLKFTQVLGSRIRWY